MKNILSLAFALMSAALSVFAGTVQFTENTEPFANPAQGWTAYWNWDRVTNHCNVGCGYGRYQWRHFNPAEGVYDWRILEKEIEFYAKKGLPFYFRIMTCSRNGGRRSIVPDWVWKKGAKYKPFQGSKYNWGEGGSNRNETTEMWCPVWNDEIFLAEHERFIRALAEKYDGDPRLYAIDIGSYGNWGEWHCWRLGKDGVSDRDYGADDETKWRIMRMYTDAFRKTELIAMTDDVPTLVRLFKGGGKPPAGLRRDGVGMPKLFKRWGKSGWKYDAVDGMDDVWKEKPVAFEWLQPLSRLMKPGDRAFEKGQKMDDIGYAVKWMLDRHVSTIDTVPFFPWQLEDYPEKKKDTRLLDLYAGARLVPVSASVVREGGGVSVVLSGENKGVAPIYAPYRLALCVKSAGWQRDFDVDLRKCLPGAFRFKGEFPDVPEGMLSVRIRHEHGIWRDFRFASTDLDADGSLVLGMGDGGSAAAEGAGGLRETVLYDAATQAARIEGPRLELVVEGKWDLSDCSEIAAVFKDGKTVNDSYSLKLFNPGGDFKLRKGVYSARFAVSRNGVKQETVRLPPDLGEWRLVEEKLVSMRTWALPKQVWDHETQDVSFYAAQRRGGVVCDMIDLKNVVKLTVGMNNPAKFDPSKILRIVARGKPRSTDGIVPWARLGLGGFFPFIDRYGQFIHRDWPGKVKCDADLERARKEEEKDLAAHPGPSGRNRWGGWLGGPQLEATGHFRVEKLRGKWWFVDPDGRLWWSHGPLRVTPSSAVTPVGNREYWFDSLPPRASPEGLFYTTRDELLWPSYEKRGVTNVFDFSACNIARKYGRDWRNVWADLAHRRLRSWGANTIGNSSDRDLCLMGRTPYCDRFELKCRPIEKAKGAWWPFRDPFDPGFRAEVRRQMKLHEREMNDPWCFGFFVDNELEWGGETSLAQWTWESRDSQPAKIEFRRRLAARYGKVPEKPSKEDLKEFSSALCEAYFATIRDEFKKAAPHKLYMGCRFAGGYPKKFALAAAVKYSDVVSFNIYRRDLSEYRWWTGAFDKPVIIGEFHSGALDRGPLSPGIVHVRDQAERAEVYRQFVGSALRHPLVVGAHWHQFSDQATSGRFDGENLQVGWTDVCDTPYPETVRAVRDMGERMYGIRWEDGK